MLYQSPPIAAAHTFSIAGKISDYAAFIKLRLTLLVVFSAVTGYMLVAGAAEWEKVVLLALAGFMITGAANGFNEILEKDSDAIMQRTHNRPLPQKRMSVTEGLIAASVMATGGIFILFYFLNPLSALLSALSMALYVLAYTPLKKKSSLAVLVGAFPGAFPPLLGAVAATGEFGIVPFAGMVMFAIQFLWQFPHFWSIAWVMNNDYKKAGFRLLPSGNPDRASAFQIMLYTLFLLLMSMTPVFFQITKTSAAPALLAISGILFFIQTRKLYRELSVKAAQRVMYGSFVYLPVVQLTILFG